MGDIVEFLEARIAEDEAAVDHRGDIPHAVHLSDVYGAYNQQCPDCLGLAGKERVRAECAAKRAIIDEYTGSPAMFQVLAHMAAIYSEHPDYQQEWAT